MMAFHGEKEPLDTGWVSVSLAGDRLGAATGLEPCKMESGFQGLAWVRGLRRPCPLEDWLSCRVSVALRGWVTGFPRLEGVPLSWPTAAWQPPSPTATGNGEGPGAWLPGLRVGHSSLRSCGCRTSWQLKGRTDPRCAGREETGGLRARAGRAGHAGQPPRRQQQDAGQALGDEGDCPDPPPTSSEHPVPSPL